MRTQFGLLVYTERRPSAFLLVEKSLVVGMYNFGMHRTLVQARHGHIHLRLGLYQAHG